MKYMFCGCLMAFAGAITIVAPAHAQFPTKPVRLIVPQPPGGIADVSARIIAQGLSTALGKQVLVDNRAGAGGNIAAEIAAKSPPDGYTVLWGFITHTINVTLYDQLNYNLTRDFAPVSLLVSGPWCVAVHPSAPAKTLKDLAAIGKARPGQLDFGYSGNGPLLAAAMFLDMTGGKMNQVPYKGTSAAMTAVVRGEVAAVFTGLVGAYPLAKSGRLRVLAVTTAQRSPLAPDIPTISESGLKGYEATTWYGAMVPAGTPNAIIARLHDDSVKAIKQPETLERLAAAGIDPIGNTPEQFGAYIRSEIDKWGKLVKISGAHPD